MACYKSDIHDKYNFKNCSLAAEQGDAVAQIAKSEQMASEWMAGL